MNLSLNGHGPPEGEEVGFWVQQDAESGMMEVIARGPVTFILEGLLGKDQGLVRMLLDQVKELHMFAEMEKDLNDGS
tara:strand:- start:743 stop:973 length:231 start_codon:yes stop_codon:yes gene_type:complete